MKIPIPHISKRTVLIIVCGAACIIGSFVLGITAAADDGSDALKAELQNLQTEAAANSAEWATTLPIYESEAQHCVVAEGKKARLDELAYRNDKNRARIQTIKQQLSF